MQRRGLFITVEGGEGVGKSTNISLRSAWKHPRFDGAFLPDTRDITEEGFEALLSNPDADKYPNYRATPYLKKLPKDSWKTPFIYINKGSEFELISFAADRKEGGEEENKDIFKMFKASFKHIHDDTFLDPTRWDRDDI